MMKVIVTLCLTADPSHCREVRNAYPEVAMTPYTCFMTTQTEMPKVMAQYPDWYIRKWECTDGAFKEKA